MPSWVHLAQQSPHHTVQRATADAQDAPKQKNVSAVQMGPDDGASCKEIRYPPEDPREALR